MVQELVNGDLLGFAGEYLLLVYWLIHLNLLKKIVVFPLGVLVGEVVEQPVLKNKLLFKKINEINKLLFINKLTKWIKWFLERYRYFFLT